MDWIGISRGLFVHKQIWRFLRGPRCVVLLCCVEVPEIKTNHLLLPLSTRFCTFTILQFLEYRYPVVPNFFKICSYVPGLNHMMECSLMPSLHSPSFYSHIYTRETVHCYSSH